MSCIKNVLFIVYFCLLCEQEICIFIFLYMFFHNSIFLSNLLKDKFIADCNIFITIFFANFSWLCFSIYY